ncbi:MAG: hypothetical protein R3C56_25830 [Pirellulaceae bacterium]
MIANLDPKLAFVIQEIKRRFNVVVRPFELKRFDEEVRLFLDIYNRSLVGLGVCPHDRCGSQASSEKGSNIF